MSTQELVSTYGPSMLKGLAVAGIGGAAISQLMMKKADADSGAPKNIFGRAGPSFTRLTLESSEEVNHNTKRLRFALPSEDAITGLPLTCKCFQLCACNKSLEKEGEKEKKENTEKKIKNHHKRCET